MTFDALKILVNTSDASTLPVATTFPVIFTFCVPTTIAGTFVSPAPLPTKNAFVMMFPMMFICPTAIALPATITPVDTLAALTFSGANTLPMMLIGCVLVAEIPAIVEPLPTKYAAETFPTTETCPDSITFPALIIVVVMFCVSTFALATTFPTMSMFAERGTVSCTDSNNIPFPIK
ncbi:hypothetical protein NY2A_b051R [Paramecium bursaria Chlorella virus NY2A]|uniref:Uncharacterized protein b051R n=1 Tax=Paramecium bursaria Chlorella virus NY2A TaxID=46021 RepID=A7IVS6_PBCVN|nr:hypothetical protein NY2A_b051R [Paramecium bursaria Chlorella virus NY2A]ABT14450.1 hypothetical protein NY2A_b051R [Paramecium bursaria Chlorella virus NY2A]